MRKGLYSNIVKDHKGNENIIVIYSDSIANCYRNNKVRINNSIRSGQIRFRNSPGTTSGELLNYIDPTLAERNYDTTIVHVGINDIINDDSWTKVENLVLNLEKFAIKLKNYRIKNVCLPGFIFTTTVYLSLLNQIRKCILDICQTQNISFINNNNIIRNDMYNDGLHLLRSGKFFLSNNFMKLLKIF